MGMSEEEVKALEDAKKAYNEAVAKAKEAGVELSDDMTVADDCKDKAKFEAATKAINDAVEEAQAGGKLEVKELKVVDADTLDVEFNRALTDKEKEKVTFELKKGNVDIEVAAEWNEEKTNVNLNRSIDFPAAEYALTVKGLEEELTASVKVEARKAVSIEISTETVGKSTKEKVDYVVKDQYGVDMKMNASKITLLTYNVTDSSRTVSGKLNALNTNSANDGDVIKLTAYLTKDKKVKVVKEIKISNSPIVSVELGDPKLPKGALVLEPNLENVVIPLVVKNALGDTVKMKKDTSVSSGDVNQGVKIQFSGIAKLAIDEDGNFVVKLGSSAGTNTITVSIASEGYLEELEIKVVKAPAVAKIELSQPEKNGMIADDASTAIYVPFTLEDQYGNPVTTEDDAWSMGNITVSSGDTNIAAVAKDGNKIKVTPATGAAAKDGTVTIKAKVGSPYNYEVEIDLDVKEARKATKFELNGTPKKNELAVSTATTEIENGDLSFKVYDQYGDLIALAGDSAKGIRIDVARKGTILTNAADEVLDSANCTDDGITNAKHVTAGASAGKGAIVAKLFINKAADNAYNEGTDELIQEMEIEYKVVAKEAADGKVKGKFAAGGISVGTTAISSKAKGYEYIGTAHGTPATNQGTLEYLIEDQAGAAYNATSGAVKTVWTIKNNGADDVKYNAETAAGNAGLDKTLKAGKSVELEISSNAGANAKTAIIFAAKDANSVADLEISVCIKGNEDSKKTVKAYVAPASRYMNADDSSSAAPSIKGDLEGEIVAFSKDGDADGTDASSEGTFLMVRNDITTLVLNLENGKAFLYEIDGNSAGIDEGVFESKLELGKTVKIKKAANNAWAAKDFVNLILTEEEEDEE